MVQPRRSCDDLSPPELANLRWLAHGLSQVDVARARGVSIETVKMQVERARLKLAAKTTAHAVAIAMRQGQIL